MGSAAGVDGQDLGIPGLEGAERIGSGGFGVVYRARQPDLSRVVAVKVLHDGIRDERVRQRFDREIRAMGKLGSHPNIVTIYGHGLNAQGHPYILMDFLPDGSLADVVERHGAMPWADVLSAGVQLCGALETAHQAGVLHRDIKPENVLLSEYGDPQLCDFGIARLDDAPHTKTGTLTASIAHCAPELLDGASPSVATDVYAVGSTVFALLQGRPAFTRTEDQSLVSVFVRIATDPVPDLRAAGVPDAVCAVVEASMAKEPDRRPASAAALGDALQEVQQRLGVPITPMKVSRGRARSIRETVAGAPLPELLDEDAPPAATTDVSEPTPSRATPREVEPQPAVSEATRTVTGPHVAQSEAPSRPASSSREGRSRALLFAAPALVLVALIGVVAVVVLRDDANPGGSSSNGEAGLDLGQLEAAQITLRDLPGVWVLESQHPGDLADMAPCALTEASLDEHIQAFRGGRPGPVVVSALAVTAGPEVVTTALERLRDCPQVATSRGVDVGDAGVLAVTDVAGPPAHQHALVVFGKGATLAAVRVSGYPDADESLAVDLALDVAQRLDRLGP